MTFLELRDPSGHLPGFDRPKSFCVHDLFPRFWVRYSTNTQTKTQSPILILKAPTLLGLGPLVSNAHRACFSGSAGVLGSFFRMAPATRARSHDSSRTGTYGSPRIVARLVPFGPKESC